MTEEAEYAKLKKRALRIKTRHKAAQAKEDAEIKDRGIPNWRNSEDYPVWQKLTKDQQKWEFLRRSPSYRNDWSRYLAAKAKKHNTIIGEYLAPSYGLKKLIDPKIDWKLFREKFSGHAAKGCEGFPIIEESESFLASTRAVLPDATNNGWPDGMEELAYKMGTPRDDPYGLIVNVRFSLEFSPEKQAAFVCQRLKQMQKVRKKLMADIKPPKGQEYGDDDYLPIKIRERNRAGNKKARDKNVKEENHILLLHVLDAANCGLKHEDIAAGLTEHEILTGETWDASTISRKVAYAKNLWRQM